MSFIQNLFTSRDNNANAATYVGQQDRLWYNPITQTLYVSDGTTPGGIPVNLATGANITANVITVNELTSTSGTIEVTGNLTITGNISPASTNKIGGIFPGPGVVIGNTGQLTIDSANLPVSFGNFFANNNILSIVNMNEDMIIETQGNAEVQLIGNIGFYSQDGGTPTGQYFKATKDGQIFIYVPTTDTLFGAVEIIGSTTGNTIAPGLSGAMLHVTGQIDTQNRIYFDGNGDYVAINGRSWNGNILSGIQAIQAGEDVLRINATAATSAGMGNVAFAQIRYTAIENQTPTAQGGNINFWATAAGANANSRIEVANISVANGVSATKFTTMGNVTANVLVSAAGSLGNLFVDCNLIPIDPGCELGSPTRPWASAWFGPQSVTLLDSTSNIANTVVLENNSGNITMRTAGFEVKSLATGNSIFRIQALTGQLFSTANTIIQNATDSANTTSGSLQTAGGLGVVKNAYIGGNTVVTGNITGGNIATANSSINTNISTTGNVIAGDMFRYNIATNNGTATQLTNKATPVTCNGRTGQITTSNASLAKGAAVTFTVNNNYISAATDVVIVNLGSGATNDSYAIAVTNVDAAGSFRITLTNNGAGALTDTLVINFAVIKVS